jgi:hypothetical protein
MTIEQARNKAAEISAGITIDKNPAEDKLDENVEINLDEMLAKYLREPSASDVERDFKRFLNIHIPTK